MDKFTVQRRNFIKALSAVLVFNTSLFSVAGGVINRKDSRQSWPKNLIRAVQGKLNEKGFDSGVADGLMGPKTKAAIKAFQYAKDLPVDGKISDNLLKALGF